MAKGRRKKREIENQNSTPLDVNKDLKVLRTPRIFAPSDFIFKIQSFSSLLGWTTKKVESRIFESGGYKWRLCLSSRGGKKEDDGDHISLYLSVADTDKLPSGWEVLVNFKFFLFDQIKNEYLCVQDGDGKVWRFHCLKSEWGFDHLMPLSTFSNPTNGYLVDDCCAFGAEVYVIKPNNATFEFLDLSKTIQSPIFSWKVKEFKKCKTTKLCSPEFIIGGWRWKLILYPNGNVSHEAKSLSLFLDFLDYDSLGESELETKFKLRIIDQVSGKSNERGGTTQFSSSAGLLGPKGYSDFLSLKDITDATKNYLLDNTLLLEVEICWMSKVKEIKISEVPMDFD